MIKFDDLSPEEQKEAAICLSDAYKGRKHCTGTKAQALAAKMAYMLTLAMMISPATTYANISHKSEYLEYNNGWLTLWTLKLTK